MGKKNNTDNVNIEPKSERKKPVKKNKVKEETDFSYLRLPENNILFELDKQDNKIKSEAKKNILKMIDKCHNYLYNSENIEGEDALNDIMNFLFIKSIQPIISDKEENGKIDLLNKKYYEHLYDDKQLTEIFSYFQNLSNLSKKELNDIRNLNEDTDAIRQMGDILKTHKITKQIFTENNFIKARKAPTIQGLLNEVIIPLNITEIEQNEDVIGEIYEHIINGYVKKGSKLGQFFTPRKLMKLIFNYKEDRINEIIKKLDKEIKFYDSCMGTGGWLVTGYNLFKDKYGDRILLSGGEVKSTTFQYGLMNLILTLKKFPDEVTCESSLTHINNTKHHFVLTNPPFQTDKKFEQIKENFKSDKSTTEKNKIKLDDVYNLKDNSPPIQFLELNKYKLEENGLCLIILPYGELFFGSSNTEARKYFMKETNITDIILFEGGTFTHTGIKTCALIFEKYKKGTKAINFIQANKECNTLTKITTVSIDDIEKEPNSSWYLRDYLKDEYIESLSSKMTNFEWVEFGDIFTLEKGKLSSEKIENDDNGNILLITKGVISETSRKIQSDIYYNEGLFIANAFNGNGKCPIRYTEELCIHTNLMSRLVINDKYKNNVSIKYIYYYLNSIKEHIETTYEKGSCNKSLDQKNFNRMKIPIPPLEEQNKINIKFNLLYDEIKIIKELQIISEKQLIEYFELCLFEYTNENKKLQEVVSEFNTGKSFSSDYISESDLYPSYGSNGIMDYVDKYIYDGEYILLGRTGSCGYVHYVSGKFHAGDTVFVIKPSNLIKAKYLYYLLKLYKNNNVYALEGKGSVVGVINKTKLNELKLIIPSIENQEKILEKLEIFEKSVNNYIKDHSQKIKEMTFKFNEILLKSNIDKLMNLDTNEEINEEIKEVPKKKTKSKSNVI